MGFTSAQNADTPDTVAGNVSSRIGKNIPAFARGLENMPNVLPHVSAETSTL